MLSHLLQRYRPRGVVADLHHEMFWGVPGYIPAGTAQDLRFLRDSAATLIKVNDTGGDGMVAARSTRGGLSSTSLRPLDPAPPRQLRNRDGASRPVTVRPVTGAATPTEQPL